MTENDRKWKCPQKYIRTSSALIYNGLLFYLSFLANKGDKVENVTRGLSVSVVQVLYFFAEMTPKSPLKNLQFIPPLERFLRYSLDFCFYNYCEIFSHKE